MTNINVTGGAVLALGGLGVLAYLVATSPIDEAVDSVLNAARRVLPWEQDNYIYSGVNELGATVSGNEAFNVGSFLYDNRNNFFFLPVTTLFEAVRFLRGD